MSHHTSFGALEHAVQSGCQLCTLFRRALIDAYMSQCGWPEPMVIGYHGSFDRHKFFISPTKTLARSGGHLNITLTNLPVNGAGSVQRGIGSVYGILYQRHFHELSDGQLAPKRITHGETIRGSRGSMPDDVNGIVIAPWLSLSSISGRSAHVSGRVIARLPDLKLCSTWVNQCLETHEHCKPLVSGTLPTRLIDVGDGESLAAKLVETKGLSGQYVTLSHCWGGLSSLATPNYEEYLSAIPFATLPKTFQDAIYVVRAMGYRYLWIDSLCIKQGDKDDWERECARMDLIFENSAFTIAAASAPSSLAGFLHSRPKPSLPAYTLPAARSKKQGDLVISLSELAPTSSGAPPQERDSPLSSRGWVLQERMLSPRVIYFGSQQMFRMRDDRLL